MTSLFALLLLTAVADDPPTLLQPAAPVASGVAAAPAAPARGAAAWYLAAGMGLTSQVDQQGRGSFLVETGLLVGGARLRGGVLAALEGQGSLGQFHGAGARVLGASLLGGVALRPPDRPRLELLAEAGLQHFEHVGPDDLSFERWEGGGATRPFVGARLLLGLGGPGGPVRDWGLSLFARATQGGSSVPYRVTTCPIFGTCTEEMRQARYGGGAVGLLLQGSLDFPSAPTPTPDEP